ncbi:putative Ig domain-containing protein, partial [Poseidonibacter sp.]|uniref:putative Ig domain-containing protein n=1 Tax=Poseidonibacter sp. TaxID=2321188 RepID=UPI003C767D8C
QNVSSLFTDVDITDSFKYEITGLPEGLSFNPITGEISGNPTETGIFEIIIKAINTKDEQDIVDKTYKIEVLPANTSEVETPKEEISETIEQEVPSKVEVNKFVSNDVQGVLDSSSKEASDFDLGKGFIQYNLTPNSSNITDNIQTDISGNIAIRINDEGKVEFSDTVADTFDEIGLSIEVMSRIDNYIEMKVTDVQLGQRYEIYLSDGSPLPKGITFDEKTGLLKGNLIDGLEITIKAISESGVIRTLNVKIDINDKDESQKTSEEASLGLQEQIEQKASSMQDYGNKISSLFSDQLV